MKKQFNAVLPEDFKLTTRKCLICGKPTQGYGAFSKGYVCSHRCNDTYMSIRPSLVDYVILESDKNS